MFDHANSASVQSFREIGFIGFGELAQTFTAGLGGVDRARVAAFDIKFDQAGSDCLKAARALGVRIASDIDSLLAGAHLVFSAVTAENSGTVAAAVGPVAHEGMLFIDLNSVSPGRKRQSASCFKSVDSYVDLAVMAPVQPLGLGTPCLVSGPSAREAHAALSAIGMNVCVVDEIVGNAAVIKMIRSVMVKGLESLTYECLASAHVAGVLPQVLDSLDKSFPAMKWRSAAAYNISRMLDHGIRRAAEMREAAKTVAELGLDPVASLATVEHQQRLGELHEPGDLGLGLEGMLELIMRRHLQRIEQRPLR